MKTLFTDRRVQVFAALLLGFLLGWALLGRTGHEHAVSGSDAAMTAEPVVWTCSMHPQIRQDNPGKCPLCGMDLTPLADPSRPGAAPPGSVRLSPEALALAEVRTAIAEAATPERSLFLQGRIAPDESAVRTLSATFSGRIERLHTAYTGGTVRAGAPLFSIRSPDLEAAQRELIEAARLRSTHPELFAAAHARLVEWGVPEARLDAVVAAGAPDPVVDVQARHGGTILARRVAPGDYVGRGDPLYTLADLRRVWVLLDAHEGDLAWLAPGDSATFSAGAVPGRTFRAKVTFVDPVLDPRTRTARVRLEVDNPDGQLRPEQFVQATVQTRAASATGAAASGAMVRVPATAVLWTGPRSVVYVREGGGDGHGENAEDALFRMREVTLGPRAGAFQFIADGLSAGEVVVAQGAFAVDAAAQLAGGHGMMTRTETPASRTAPTGHAAPAASAAPSASTVSPVSMTASAEFRASLEAVTDAYLAWSAALVAGDGARARREAGALHRAADAVDAGKLPQAVAASWRSLHRAVAAAAGTDDLEASRARFKTASDALIAVLDRAGSPRAGLHVDWCPMANDDRGAYWLSADEALLNPYYGDAMLRCGDRLRTLPGGP